MRWPEGCGVVAYADDAAIYVQGDSRNELEMKCSSVTGCLQRWADLHKMNFSAAKTSAMLLKETLHRGRRPVVTLNRERIRFSEYTKYLEIVMEGRLWFKKHIEEVGRKALDALQKKRRVERATWGLDFTTRKVIYTAVFEGILLYAAQVWGDRMEYIVYQKLLNRFQRLACSLW